jgi:hypothetical protein
MRLRLWPSGQRNCIGTCLAFDVAISMAFSAGNLNQIGQLGLAAIGMRVTLLMNAQHRRWILLPLIFLGS